MPSRKGNTLLSNPVTLRVGFRFPKALESVAAWCDHDGIKANDKLEGVCPSSFTALLLLGEFVDGGVE